MMAEFNLGNIVIISEEGYAFKKIGVVSDPRGMTDYTWSKNATGNERIPVMFPGFVRPRWFDGYNMHHVTEAEHKQYFKDRLRNG